MAARSDLPGKKNWRLSTLKYIYLKEFIITYFSATISSNNYYCWPNNENKNSAIHDFFDSFMLNNFVKMNLSIYERDTRYDRYSTDGIYEKGYYFPSKISNLFFIPNTVLFHNIPSSYLSKTICLPLIFDFKHSWKDLYQYKITENFELVAEKGKKYTFMEPGKYLPDTKIYEAESIELFERMINFNYDVTDITWSIKDPKKEPSIILPGLHPQTCEQILYYLLEIQNYVNNQSSIYDKIFANPQELNTGLEDIDSFFNTNLVLEHFKEWKLHGIPEEDNSKIGYNVIETLIESFLGKDITKANISLLDPTHIQKYPLYREYFEGTEKKDNQKE